VSLRSRFWPVAILVLSLAAAVVGGALWYRSAALSDAELIQRLPMRDTLLVSIDFAQLRAGGILQLLGGPATREDPDYARFVERTGFDYRRDLDRALLALAPGGKYMFVRGRFDWKRLEQYAKDQGGDCSGGLCRMQGSAPERKISFFRLRSGLLALAVTPEPDGVDRLRDAAEAPVPEIPTAPIWLSIPASFLRSDELPSGTHMFARSMQQAQRVILSFSTEGSRLGAHLDVLCRSDQDASEIASQLSQVTSTLRQMIEREHQTPNPADLSGVLTSGSFRAEGRKVIGYWPIERSFVENVLSGGD
jgi:hypothetical protein